MRGQFYLPEKKDAIEQCLRYHGDLNDTELQRFATTWTRCHWWVQGVRNLQITSALRGAGPGETFVDSKGVRRVPLETAVQQMFTDMGRILSIDWGPRVSRKVGISLDDIRGTAISEAVLDLFWSRFRTDEFLLQWAQALSTFGTVAAGAFDLGDPRKGVFGATLMLIPAWEVTPLPATPVGLNEVSGTSWGRWVPLRFIKDMLAGPGLIQLPKNLDELEPIEGPSAGVLQSAGSPTPNVPTPGMSGVPALTSSYYGPPSRRLSNRGTAMDEPTEKYVLLKDHWVESDDGSVLRHLITVGPHLAHDTNYEELGGELPLMPVKVFRRDYAGGFYGRGVVERLVPLNRQMELLLADVITNVADADRMRFLAIPRSSGINERSMRLALKNRYLTYDPDPSAPQHRPELIVAPNVGDSGGRLLSTMMGMTNSLVAQPSMLQGQLPGARMDSAAALSVMTEQGNVPMKPVVISARGAWKGLYRKLLSIFNERIPDQEVLPLIRVDESMIGVKYDPAAGGVKLAENPIPNPRSLEINIRSENPRPKSQIKMELDEALEKGLISKIEYRIEAWRAGLELPLGSQAAQNNWLTASVENLILFGDGQTPGQPQANMFANNHPIHYMVHQAFMASPVFMAASAEVRQAFTMHLVEQHQPELGPIPDGLETLDMLGQVGPPSGPAISGVGAGMPLPGPGQFSPMDMMAG